MIEKTVEPNPVQVGGGPIGSNIKGDCSRGKKKIYIYIYHFEVEDIYKCTYMDIYIYIYIYRYILIHIHIPFTTYLT